MARRLAVAVSHAAGLSGTPDCGHCSSAATSASCASSSARPTSLTMRVSPAMILADSIRQIDSTTRWVSPVAMRNHDNTFHSRAQPRRRYLQISRRHPSTALGIGRNIFHSEHLANFAFTFPAGPVLAVQINEVLRDFQSFLFGLQVHDCEAADDFLGFGERTVDNGNFPAGEPNTVALRRGGESSAHDHGAVFYGVHSELLHGIHQGLGWHPGIFRRFYHHHESHRFSSLR